MLKRCSVVPFFLAVIAAARVFLQSRTDLAVEILALRQQVAVLKRRRPKPPLHPLDRLFWTVLRATWSRWKDALFIVKPETVVGWHRAGFQLYWRWKSRPRGDRPRTFRVLYCFFVIEHGRRRILHFNVTPHPSADWVVQQLRESVAEAAPYRYVILD